MPKKGEIIRSYQVGERIGKGSFGKVFLVVEIAAPANKFAMKVLEDAIMTEEMKIGMGLSANCSFLVKYKDIFASNEGDEFYIVMELCEGGDLYTHLKSGKRLSEVEIFRFVYESTMALKCLHDAGITHRDIKSSNFFLANGGFKLGDYGVARALARALSNSLTRVGTNGYTAPEINEGKNYTEKVDIFSLGITFMEIVLGYNPFSNPDGELNVMLAVNCTPVAAAQSHTHPVMTLARRMMARDPAARPDTDGILTFQIALVAVLRPLHAACLAGDINIYTQAQAQADRKTKTGGEGREEALQMALREKDQAVREMQAALEGVLREKEKTVRGKEEALQGALREKEAALKEKDQAVREMQAALEGALREKETAVREKDQALRRATDLEKDRNVLATELTASRASNTKQQPQEEQPPPPPPLPFVKKHQQRQLKVLEVHQYELLQRGMCPSCTSAGFTFDSNGTGKCAAVFCGQEFSSADYNFSFINNPFAAASSSSFSPSSSSSSSSSFPSSSYSSSSSSSSFSPFSNPSHFNSPSSTSFSNIPFGSAYANFSAAYFNNNNPLKQQPLESVWKNLNDTNLNTNINSNSNINPWQLPHNNNNGIVNYSLNSQFGEDRGGEVGEGGSGSFRLVILKTIRQTENQIRAQRAAEAGDIVDVIQNKNECPGCHKLMDKVTAPGKKARKCECGAFFVRDEKKMTWVIAKHNPLIYDGELEYNLKSDPFMDQCLLSFVCIKCYSPLKCNNTGDIRTCENCQSVYTLVREGRDGRRWTCLWRNSNSC